MILSDGTTDIVLPDELRWIDEMDWTELAVQDGRSITGKIVRQTSDKVGGRPITLAPPDDFYGRVLYSTVKQLRDWSDDSNKVMTLTFENNDSFPVVFNYDKKQAISAHPLFPYSKREDNEWWLVTIYLITAD